VEKNGRFDVSPLRMAATFRAFLVEKERFCDNLELLADLLPDGVEPGDCLLIAQNIVPLIQRAHDYEEHVVYPRIVADRTVPTEIKDSLERLKFEHIGDEDYSCDLSLALRDFIIDRGSVSVDSLAWMLRGFFEGLRRHVAFEREHLLPWVERLER
jgi:hemerythrin-like domain-containing protein